MKTLTITHESLVNLISWFNFMIGYAMVHKDPETAKKLADVMLELDKVRNKTVTLPYEEVAALIEVIKVAANFVYDHNESKVAFAMLGVAIELQKSLANAK